MNNKLVCAITFVTGAAIGSLVTWKLVQNKYKQLADEEIASVKEVFSKREEPTDTEQPEFDPDMFIEYENKVNSEGYTSNEENEKKGEPMAMGEPYVISPDDFDEMDGYKTETLIYYADGVITTFNDEVIENVNELIGEDSLNHFGDYEDDSVFVRNDRLKTDFEILLDVRNFSDIRKSPPVIAN